MRIRQTAIGFSWLFLGCAAEEPAVSADSQADTVQMGVTWSVEPGEHPVADSLGEVSGIVQDQNGVVYVTDSQAARIWVFGPDGRFILGFGGRGEGPGEFDSPTGPGIGPDGRLYVRDVYRVTVFGENPASGFLTEVSETFTGPVYADWTSTRATRFLSDGAMLYPGKKWLEGGTSAPYFVVFGSDRELGDTIWVPDQPTFPQLTAFVRTGPGGGRMLSGLNHVPFAPLPAWDITRHGTVVSGDGQSYRLLETNRDGALGVVFSRDLPPTAITRKERGDSLRALQSRIDSIPVARDQVQGVPEEVWGRDLPDTFPAYQAIYLDEHGGLWVRRWPPATGDQTVFDVFAADGRFRHTVVLDREISVEPTPFLSDSVVLGVTRDPVTDESIVLCFGQAVR